MRILLVLMAVSLVAIEAYAQNPDSARRGQYFAERVCASCHAVAAGETRSPQPGAPSFQAIADTPGMTGMALTVWLRSPHPTMPHLIVPSDDIADLTAYLGTMRKSR